MSSTLDEEWASFLRNGVLAVSALPPPPDGPDSPDSPDSPTSIRRPQIPAGIPPLTISTQSNNARLSNVGNINIKAMFWALEMIPYVSQTEGVIKKQLKIEWTTPEELRLFEERLKTIRSHVLSKVKHIDDPAATTQFKYVAKLSIGLASKEVRAHRAQEKDAFFNSFTMVLRVRYQGRFKEIVTKVFNKGVLSLPGMLDDELRINTLALVDRVLSQASLAVAPTLTPLVHLPGTITDVMVNSNFWCGFGLDRDKVVAELQGRGWTVKKSGG